MASLRILSLVFAISCLVILPSKAATENPLTCPKKFSIISSQGRPSVAEVEEGLLLFQPQGKNPITFPSLSPSHASQKSIDLSYQPSVELVTAPRDKFSSSMLMVKGDLFQEGFGRLRMRGAGVKNFNSFAVQQPWLEWDSAQGIYKFKTSGASVRLLDTFTPPGAKVLHLYRGLHRGEKKLLELVHELRSSAASADHLREAAKKISDIKKDYVTLGANLPPSGKEKLRKLLAALDQTNAQIKSGSSFLLNMDKRRGRARAVLEIIYGDRGLRPKSFYSTPNAKKGKGWGKPGFVESEISVDALKDFAERGHLYVGIEYNYLELAFGDVDSIEIFADGLQF